MKINFIFFALIDVTLFRLYNVIVILLENRARICEDFFVPAARRRCRNAENCLSSRLRAAGAEKDYKAWPIFKWYGYNVKIGKDIRQENGAYEKIRINIGVRTWFYITILKGQRGLFLIFLICHYMTLRSSLKRSRRRAAFLPQGVRMDI